MGFVYQEQSKVLASAFIKSLGENRQHKEETVDNYNIITTKVVSSTKWGRVSSTTMCYFWLPHMGSVFIL